jgi:small subunit ribosomal protein S8
MMTDPLSDMLTRIRNAIRIERPAVDMPLAALKTNVARVLKEEGFILDFEVGMLGRDTQNQLTFVAQADAQGPQAVLRVYLKYGPDGEKVIRTIDRASRPGRRLYRGYDQLAPVLDGLGIAILSTNRGVMSDRRARKEKVGGELLCTVW